jgi:hypothetical protein
MNNDDIEKLRPLANNTKHLMKIILEKMKKQANDAGHEISIGLEDIYYDGWAIESYCKKCAYQIEIILITTDKKEEKIYVKEIQALENICNKTISK